MFCVLFKVCRHCAGFCFEGRDLLGPFQSHGKEGSNFRAISHRSVFELVAKLTNLSDRHSSFWFTTTVCFVWHRPDGYDTVIPQARLREKPLNYIHVGRLNGLYGGHHAFITTKRQLSPAGLFPVGVRGRRLPRLPPFEV